MHKYIGISASNNIGINSIGQKFVGFFMIGTDSKISAIQKGKSYLAELFRQIKRSVAEHLEKNRKIASKLR